MSDQSAEDRGRITVVLADDHSMVREALARVLDDSGSIRVVGQARDGRGVLRVVERAQPDCIVLDYSMPELDAPAVIKALLRDHPRAKILVLTVHENTHYAVRALESGAHGYLIKSAAVDELVTAIKSVHRGDVYISPKVSQQILQQMRRPRRTRTGLGALSQREFDFVRLIGSGKSLRECARRMNVSTSTVSTYRARVLEKLSLASTAELIRFALDHDITG